MTTCYTLVVSKTDYTKLPDESVLIIAESQVFSPYSNAFFNKIMVNDLLKEHNSLVNWHINNCTFLYFRKICLWFIHKIAKYFYDAWLMYSFLQHPGEVSNEWRFWTLHISILTQKKPVYYAESYNVVVLLTSKYKHLRRFAFKTIISLVMDLHRASGIF